MTDQPTPDFTSPIAGRIEVRDPCPWCGDRQMIPRSQMDEHCARLHPDVKTAVSSAGVVQLPPTNQAALRDRIAEALYASDHPGHLVPLHETGLGPAYVATADAVLKVLPAPVDRAVEADRDWWKKQAHAVQARAEVENRAAVLLEAADAIEADSWSRRDRWGRYEREEREAGMCDAAELLRRMAAEAPATEEQDAVRPRRGDQFETWLKAQRDAASDYPEAHQAADGLLDLYRLHADTGTPLGEHVCEGRVVGDCECLETEPAAVVQPAQPHNDETPDRVVADPRDNKQQEGTP